MPDPNPAADWLIAEFDAASFEDIFSQPEHSAEDEWPVHPWPMLSFKSVMEPGEPMHVSRADYYDRQRWWL